MATRSQAAYALIRSRIETGEYRPGQRLKIRDLALQTRTSDIPVREAIQRLAAEGFVTYTPHVGISVASIPPERLVDLLVTGAVLDGAATRLAAPHLTASMLERLHELLAEQRRAAEAADHERYFEVDRQFHQAILSSCPVRELAEAASATLGRADRHQLAGRPACPPGRLLVGLDQHTQLLVLLDERPLQLDQIEALARRHKLDGALGLNSRDGVRELRRADLLPGGLPAREQAPGTGELGAPRS